MLFASKPFNLCNQCKVHIVSQMPLVRVWADPNSLQCTGISIPLHTRSYWLKQLASIIASLCVWMLVITTMLILHVCKMQQPHILGRWTKVPHCTILSGAWGYILYIRCHTVDSNPLMLIAFAQRSWKQVKFQTWMFKNKLLKLYFSEFELWFWLILLTCSNHLLVLALKLILTPAGWVEAEVKYVGWFCEG